MTPNQANHLRAAVQKLQAITAENRAYLMTPTEAAALITLIERQAIGGKHLLALSAIPNTHLQAVRPRTSAPDQPPFWTAEIQNHLDSLYQRGVDMENDAAEDLYNYVLPDLTRRQADQALDYWRQLHQEATPA